MAPVAGRIASCRGRREPQRPARPDALVAPTPVPVPKAPYGSWCRDEASGASSVRAHFFYRVLRDHANARHVEGLNRPRPVDVGSGPSVHTNVFEVGFGMNDLGN